MLSLETIFLLIEREIGEPIDALPWRDVFDSQSIWNVITFAEGQDDVSWTSIDPRSGDVKRCQGWGTPGEHVDHVMFGRASDSSWRTIVLAEADVGVQFAATRDQLVKFDRSETSRKRGYVGDLDFANLGGDHGAWSIFIEEWKALLNRWQ